MGKAGRGHESQRYETQEQRQECLRHLRNPRRHTQQRRVGHPGSSASSGGGVAVVGAGEGKYDDEANDGEYGKDEDTAFRARGAAAHEGFANGVRGYQMVLDHEPAVCDAVEKGLRPVPRRVEADGPPERPGAPEAEAENKAGETGGEQTDGGLSGIFAVTETEEDGKNDRRGPKTERLAVRRLKKPGINSCEAASEREEQVASRQIFLQEANHEKTKEPDQGVVQRYSAGKQAGVEDEQTGFPEREDQERETRDSPSEAREEVRQRALAAQTVDTVRTFFNFRHDPGDEESDKEREKFGVEAEGRANFGLGGIRFGGEMRELEERRHAAEKCEHQHNEDEKAPAGTKAVLAEEDFIKCGRPRFS